MVFSLPQGHLPDKEMLGVGERNCEWEERRKIMNIVYSMNLLGMHLT